MGGSCGRGKVSSPWELPSPAAMSTRTERGAGGEWTLPLRDALLLAGGGGSMVLTTACGSTSRLGRAAGAHSGWLLKLRLQQVDPGRRLVPTA